MQPSYIYESCSLAAFVTTQTILLPLPLCFGIQSYLEGTSAQPNPYVRYRNPLPLSHLNAARGDKQSDWTSDTALVEMRFRWMATHTIHENFTAAHLCAMTCWDTALLDTIPDDVIESVTTNIDFTMLHTACVARNEFVVQYLLRRMPSLALKIGKHSVSPLYCAAEHGDVRIMQLLLEANPALLSINTGNECSPLFAACYHGHVDAARYLIEISKKRLLRVPTRHGFYPIHIAAQRGHLAVATLILDTDPTDVFLQTDQSKCTAAHFAADADDVGLMKKCYEVGGEDAVRIKLNSFTPFIRAVANGNITVAKYLYELNIGCERESGNYGLKALHMAAMQGDVRGV
eukprot:PhF_6_TR7328/c0_g1_i2/m.11004